MARFAGENPGTKYTRTMAIRGIELNTRRIDGIAAKAASAVQNGDIES